MLTSVSSCKLLFWCYMNTHGIVVDVHKFVHLHLDQAPLPGLSDSDGWSGLGAKWLSSSILWLEDSVVGPNRNALRVISTWIRIHPCAPLDIESRNTRWASGDWMSLWTEAVPLR